MQFMDTTVTTCFTTRDDRMPHHPHASAERGTPHCGCRVRSTVRHDMHERRQRDEDTVQDDTRVYHRHANGPYSVAGAIHAVDQHAEGCVTAALEAVGDAMAARDWECAELLIDQLKSLCRAARRTRPVWTSSASRQPDSADPGEPLLEPLRARELEVLTLVAAGYSNQDIAEQLIVSVGTVRWHLKNIYSKLDVHSRTQAVARMRAAELLNKGNTAWR